jgi:type IV secretion system protein VirB8
MIRYRYSGEPMQLEDRFVNPLGFQVLRYRRDAEALPPQLPDTPPPAAAGAKPPGAAAPAPGAAPAQVAPAPAPPQTPASPEIEL